MSTTFPQQAVQTLLVALADDELMLGHRDAEWTGHAPVLEEDIAFANIAQDELGHSLLWYTLQQQLGGDDPDTMAFARDWQQFTCCRFVTYPKGDFAYTVVRQYLFDEAEQVRLRAFAHSTYIPIKEASAKILREEAYHILHSKSLIERLGDATEESHRRIQAAVDAAFPQALGMFERLEGEEELVAAGVFPGNQELQAQWLRNVVPVLTGATLSVPVKDPHGACIVQTPPDVGGRRKQHVEHLRQLVDDLQSVYRVAPGAHW